MYDVRSVKGSPILARAAIEAVIAWRYEPARLHGAPIDSQASTVLESNPIDMQNVFGGNG